MHRTVLIISLLFTITVINAHPIKMTTGRLYFDEEKQRCELLINFFIDDFTAHLSEIYHAEVTQSNIKDPENRLMLLDYIGKNISIFDGYQQKKLSIDHVELIVENVLQVCIIVQDFNKDSSQEMKIVNSLLFDAYDNQTNILRIELGEKQKSQMIRFTPASAAYIFTME